MQTLPCEIILHICNNFNDVDLYNFALTCAWFWRVVMGMKKMIAIPLKNNYYAYDYQLYVANWMRTRGGGILSLSVGMGKTLTSLLYILATSKRLPSLVVCQKTVLNEWLTNIDKFFGIKPLILHSEYKKKTDFAPELLESHPLVLTTYGTIVHGISDIICDRSICRKYKNTYLEINKCRGAPLIQKVRKYSEHVFNIKWNTLILDEGQVACNPKSKTFKKLMAINAEKTFILSATPIRNQEEDLITLLRLCGVQNWVDMTYREGTLKRIYLKPTEYLLKQFVMKLDYADTDIEMPSFVDHQILIEQVDTQKDFYNLFKRILLRLCDAFDNGIVDYICIYAMFMRLRQICVYPQLVNYECNDLLKMIIESDDYKYFIPWLANKTNINDSIKFQAVRNLLLGELKGKKVVLFSYFTSVFPYLQLFLNDTVDKIFILDGKLSIKTRIKVIEDFKYFKGSALFLIQYKCGGKGITITEAHSCINLEPWWTPVVRDQAIGRLRRIGQKNIVHVYDIIVEDSIETKMLAIMEEKRQLIENHENVVKLTVEQINNFLR